MKNFLFDLYGTLIDIHTDEYSVDFWKEVCSLLHKSENYAGEIKKDYAMLCDEQRANIEMGRELDVFAALKQLIEKHTGKTPTKAETLNFARQFRRASMRKFKVFDGIFGTLEGLKKRGAKLYIASNAQACFTRYEIEMANLSPLFDGIILSSETGYKKPSEKFFLTVFDKFGLNKNDCVYVGNDFGDDIKGAQGVNMKCVYIQTEQSGSYENPPTPDYTAKDFKDLENILFSLCDSDN